MRMRQYTLKKGQRAKEEFSVNCFRALPAFAASYLELNELYWELCLINVFFEASRYFCKENEFIVASLSPLRGKSFLSY